MRNFIQVIFVVLIFSNFGLHAQSSVFNINETTKGASKQNWGVAYSKKGYVYFANNSGLLENYGHVWNLYKLPEQLTVRSVNVDTTNERVYTGAYQEFGYWERDLYGKLNYTSLSKNLKSHQFVNDEIWRIIFHQGKVYFQSFFNIYVFSNNKIKVLSPNKSMIFLCKARERLFIQVDNEGLYELIDEKFIFVPNSQVLANGLIRAVLPYGEHDFLIGSGTKGLFIYNNDTFEEWKAPIQELIKDKQINNGYFDGTKYYIGTIMNGVYIFDQNGERVSNYSASNYLQNNTVLGISNDNFGNVWLALDRGIDVINQFNYFHVFSTEKNILGAVYSAALFQNKIYIATNRGVYYSNISKNGISNINFEDFKEVSGVNGQTWCLKIYNNQLLCGNNEGSYVIKHNNATKISEMSGGYNFKPMNSLDNEYLLQSTYNHIVLYKYNTDSWEQSHFFKELNEPFTDIELGDEGYVWASHNLKGVYRMHLSTRLDRIESVNLYGTNQGLPAKYYNRVSKIGNRIVFTTHEGLFTYDDLNDTIVPFDRISNEIGLYNFSQKVIPIGKERYWFINGNNIALYQINQENVKLLIAYDLSDLKVNMVEQFENIVEINDSLSLICLDNGFALTSNARKHQFIGKSEIAITKATYNISDSVHTMQLPLNNTNIKLPYGKSELKIDFTATNQINKNIKYQVLLEGYRESWSDIDKSTEVIFYHLEPGEYKLRIQGIGETELPIAECEYKFEILTPWYLTLYAKLIYLALCLLLFWAVILIIKRYYKNKKEQAIKALEKERDRKTKEERLLNDQVIANLKAENLQKEISYKSKELAVSTMSLIKKNEILIEIKKEIEAQKEELGQRYPDKYYKTLIRKIDSDLNSSDEWEIFENNFNQTHNNLFKRLKKRSPELTPSDLRLCAFLRLNLTSKEIAPLLGISVRGVETHRYRLRKKFNLNSDENLFEFILQD